MSKYTAISLLISFRCIIGLFALAPLMGADDDVSLILIVSLIIILLLSFVIGYLLKIIDLLKK